MARNASKTGASHLRLVPPEKTNSEKRPAKLSSFARQMEQFADELESEIERIKNS